MTNFFNDFDPYIWKKDMQYIYEVEKIISEACGHKKVGTYVGKYVILCLVEYFDFDIQIQKYHQKYLIHKKDFERCSILKKKYSTCVEYTPRIGSERTEFYNNFWRSLWFVNLPLFKGTSTIPLQLHFFANSHRNISSFLLLSFHRLNFCNALMESILIFNSLDNSSIIFGSIALRETLGKSFRISMF